MADEIATGYGAAGANPSGAGAIIFAPSIDPLTIHMHNLGVLDQSENEREAEQQKHLQTTNAFIGALNPKIDGILPADRDFIVQEAQKNTDLGVNFLKAGAKAGSNEDATLRKHQMYLNGLIESSVQTNKQATAAIAAQNMDKGKTLNLEDGNKNIAGLVSQPLPIRNVNSGSLIVPNKDVDVNAAAQAFMKTFPEVSTKTNSIDKSGFKIETETKSRPTFWDAADPANAGNWNLNVRTFADNSPQSKQMRQAWNDGKISQKDVYVKQALAANNNDPILAAQQGYYDYASDILKKQIYYDKAAENKGETEFAKQKAKQAAQASSYNQLPLDVAGIITGNPGLYKPTTYTDPKTKNVSKVYGTTAYSNLDLGQVEITTKGTDDKVVTTKIQDHPTMIMWDNSGAHIATVQSENNYVNGLAPSPYLGTNYGESNYDELLHFLAMPIKKAAKEEGVDPLNNAYEVLNKMGARKPDGTIDPYKVAPMNDAAKALRTSKLSMGVGTTELPAANVKQTTFQPVTKTGATGAAKTYSIGGTKYKSIDEIKALSPQYTDAVIEQAIKAGKIKIQ